MSFSLLHLFMAQHPSFKLLLLLLLLLLRTHSWPRPIKEEVRAIIASHGKRKKKKNKTKQKTSANQNNNNKRRDWAANQVVLLGLNVYGKWSERSRTKAEMFSHDCIFWGSESQRQ